MTDTLLLKDSGAAQEHVYANSSTALPVELFSTLLGISPTKAQAIIRTLLVYNGGGTETFWQRIRWMTPQELEAAGLTKAQSAKVAAAIEIARRMDAATRKMTPVIDDPCLCAELLMPELGNQETERFAVVAMDIRHAPIAHRVISVGTKAETLADPGEIFAWVLRVGASRLIVAHNHPSGKLDPSTNDIHITRELLKGARILQLSLLDHIIIGKGDYQSLRQTTSLWTEI